MTLIGPDLPLTGGPLIGRRAAQNLARRELAEVSFWQRILLDLQHFFDTSSNAVPGGWFGLVVLGVLVIALIVVILAWARPDMRRRLPKGAVLADATRTAQDYRRSATLSAQAGDFGAAIVDRVRAIAAELDERGILTPRVGRTADELAIEAGAQLPHLADDLRAVTRLFDEVRYGDRPGTEAGYQQVVGVDAGVRAAPVTVGGPKEPAAAGLRVPR